MEFHLTLDRCSHRPLRNVPLSNFVVGCDAHIDPGAEEVYQNLFCAWAPPPGELSAKLTEGVRFHQT